MVDCQNLYTWVSNPYQEWIDTPYPEWGECTEGALHQVWMDQVYAYAVTSSGLSIIDLETGNNVSYIYNRDGFTTIWGNDDTIYVGTLADGIKYIDKTTISGNASAPYDLETCLVDYDYYYNVSSDGIKYIHGNEDTLVAVTASGIDILNNGTNGYKSYYHNENITKCFMTTASEVYYIVQGAEDEGIFRMNSPKCDWTVSDRSYKPGQSFLPVGKGVNDIFVTVKTSANKVSNTLFIATTSGVYVYDEETTEYDLYYTL